MFPSVLKPFKYALLVICIALAAAGFVRFFFPLVAERTQLARERKSLSSENDKISKEIAEKRRQQTDFTNDPEYIELVGRREGLVRKNEVIFDFSPKKSGR